MITSRQLFPLGKAYGAAFCNRVEETEQLVGNIRNSKHTLLIAPRRYGKSSLAERAMEKAKLPSIKINFHLSTSEQEIADLILNGVMQLIGAAIGKIEKLTNSIKKYLSNLELVMKLGNEEVGLSLIPKKQENISVIISEALLLLEKLLKEKKKRAVIFFDEFQEVDHISKTKGIEGAIRTAAQETEYLSIVFSGSIRSLLLTMFEDENRPLYKLCRKIKLDRISSADYQKHLQKIATGTWGNPLPPEVFSKIMQLSNRHPYYVNYLCDIVWEICQHPPKITDVSKAWKIVITEEWRDALKELSDLPLGQRRILKFIANHAVTHLQSRAISEALSMAVSSIATSVNTLIEKDYIEKDPTGNYQIINPLLFSILKDALLDG